MTGALLAALAAENIALVNLMELDFASGFVRAHSAVGTLTFGGNVYTGVGRYGSISATEDSEELKANSLRVTLTGVDAALISTAITENYQGRDARVWAGALDSDYQLIADPVLVFSGRMDNMTVALGDRAAAIDLTVINRLADWDRPRVRRYNSGDQKAIYSGDLFFDFVEEMVSKTLFWGKTSTI